MAVLAGMGLSFTNLDNTFHDVVAHDRDADNRPLFASDVIGNGETTPVEGVETLDPGTYPFYCSLHPGMTGDLHVVG